MGVLFSRMFFCNKSLYTKRKNRYFIYYFGGKRTLKNLFYFVIFSQKNLFNRRKKKIQIVSRYPLFQHNFTYQKRLYP
ncbi:hypothetical protein GLOIN_2v1539836 [Rhizophagus irregularis DAOM 181602=DAOM 197198]|uniref:Uncharacterized protein n=1 Tax=Rhizophagus irregularis (strain DAOM 181602 / DAOM 197198 / MUCL 43194) TaxID=747089 RepID=U9SVA2_RHIID|nr:hypothetical protein GLOIN_2v1539836 [Rhizophagus irregularis DAOM 181602=DAOM 197198]POG78181.1 hypothetical protein GLOIN_2v1539836 [Rhizophagus irregularis DAOM 181602=DAOM 197198]GBC23558.1 hypothetical protein GLOIN_2v1539836 [Rhizophagus irregularis DAOM 181602=DAOM 197198]|eukprot:XP_025185047.1 hypothetical protein GLOIN_2v1539836 [Rhizophagus irregularis DAOM 181602=DAOM 197198]